MRVSVVLPVYNGEEFLRETLESVFRQTCPVLEVLVVDDGSTDGSRALLAEYADRLRILEQDNAGVSRARNRGVEEARGDLVALLDQDDVWHEQKTERQLRVFDESPKVSFVYSDIVVLGSGSIWLPGGSRDRSLEWIRPFIRGHYHPFPSTVMMKRNLFLEQGGFSTDFSGNGHEDVEFWARLCQVTDFRFIEEPLVQYRYEREKPWNESQSREYWFTNTITLYNKLSALYGEDPRMKKDFERILQMESNQQGFLGKRYLRQGNVGEARRRFRNAWQVRKNWKNFSRVARASLPDAWWKWLFPE